MHVRAGCFRSYNFVGVVWAALLSRGLVMCFQAKSFLVLSNYWRRSAEELMVRLSPVIYLEEFPWFMHIHTAMGTAHAVWMQGSATKCSNCQFLSCAWGNLCFQLCHDGHDIGCHIAPHIAAMLSPEADLKWWWIMLSAGWVFNCHLWRLAGICVKASWWTGKWF